MMLDHLGQKEAAAAVEAAMERALADGVRTADMGGSVPTDEVGGIITELTSSQ
jgi:tartrate dehydrogenase/decarboxylase/D-malate dehydrogenase